MDRRPARGHNSNKTVRNMAVALISCGIFLYIFLFGDTTVVRKRTPAAKGEAMHRKHNSVHLANHTTTHKPKRTSLQEQMLNPKWFADKPLTATVPMVEMWHGQKMPVIGYGSWKVRTEAPIKQAFETGYQHIDSAVAYGNEEIIGNLIQELRIPRSELFITTKLLPGDFGSDSTRKSFFESLGRLRTEYVDLYLLHAKAPNWEESWRVLEELHTRGQARAIGVSNFDLSAIQEITLNFKYKPMVVQNYYNPWHPDDHVLQYCKENKIVYQSYSTLASDKMVHKLLAEPVLQRLAEKYHKSPAQIVLKWALQNGVVILPRSTTVEHAKEDLQLFDFQLDLSDVELIDALKAQ
eukprot:TRINITY_DN54724_c0_g1_i1.p1 TRINITY_DN54724_c0_g1~~TRINITY_DN54724_c0_g1_i1.p1  ORF type:complete len:352 (+),score=13.47 TRINITY_DN54724_c0_g1_i1:116-1171(+)